MKRAVLVVTGLMFIGGCSSGGSSGTSAPTSDKPVATTTSSATPTSDKAVATTAGSATPSSTTPTTAPPSTSAVATTTTTAPPSAKDATAVAEALKAKVGSVQKIVTITEDNDPNDKIGRPNGYVSAAVIYDSGGECRSLGADCGPTVDVWPSAEEAKTRSDYIQGLQKGSPILGTEYHYLNGATLLRVTGKIKPTVAKQYESAFTTD